MRRFRLIAALLLVLLPSQALAATEYQFSGTAGSLGAGKQLFGYFSTGAVTDISATASFEAKKGTTYYVKLKHFEERPCCFPPYREYCYSPLVALANGPAEVSCSVAVGPVGDWFVEFATNKGQVQAVVTVTVE
jgi:hypothetical protein